MKTLRTTVNINTKETFDHIVLRGDPFTRGTTYGLNCRERIVENLKFYKKHLNCLNWNALEIYINNNYLKALENYYPSALIEMKGVALGAGISLTDVIAINARYELTLWNSSLNTNEESKHPHECTSGVCLSKATKSGDVLMGHNWDNNKRLLFDDMVVLLEVHPDPIENISSFFTLTEVGQLSTLAMNANGLGITGMSLFSSDDYFGTDSQKGFLPISLLRRMFIESPNFSVGLKRILSVPRHVSVNMTVVSAEGEAVNIEMTPNHYFISHPSIETDIYTHSNRFKSEEFMSNSSIKDTFISGTALFTDKQLERQLFAKSGSIDEKCFESAFKNHLGFPESMCQHIPEKGREDMSTTPDMCTVANIICNLTTKSIRLCRGQPCNGFYKEYRFNYNKEKE